MVPVDDDPRRRRARCRRPLHRLSRRLHCLRGPAPDTETFRARGWRRPMSPVPMDEGSLDGLGRAALAQCGVGESGLGQVAREIFAVKAAGGRLLEPDAIAFAQRAAGEPHPWARAWSASAKGEGAEVLLAKLREWLSQGATLRRCGAASGTSLDGARILVVVSVEALADLEPLADACTRWAVDDGRSAPSTRASARREGPRFGTQRSAARRFSLRSTARRCARVSPRSARACLPSK